MILNAQRHRTSLLLIACSAITASVKAQNLIPNGDMEAYDDCSFTSQPYINVDDWVAPLCKSGFFYNNTCVPTNIPLNPWVDYAAPQNILGYQQPHSGNGYTSVRLYFQPTGESNYPAIELSSALQPVTEYCLSLMMSLTDSSSYAVNTMHALFTYVQPNLCIAGRDSLWDDMAQIVFDISTLDTANWSLLQGSFIASGGERFLTLGNFFSAFEVLSDTVELGTNSTQEMANYYVDDVSLTACDVGIGSMATASGVELYPNPAAGNTYLKTEDPEQWDSYKLHSSTGGLLQQGSISNSVTSIPLQDVASGAYVVTLVGKYTRHQERLILAHP